MWFGIVDHTLFMFYLFLFIVEFFHPLSINLWELASDVGFVCRYKGIVGKCKGYEERYHDDGIFIIFVGTPLSLSYFYIIAKFYIESISENWIAFK